MTMTSQGALVVAPTASMPNLASTPASNAAAIACGMRSITRSKPRVTPAITINAPQTTKAPTASPIATPLLPASRAAPGVDHAVSTGCRVASDRPIDVTPMPRPSAHIHDVACAGVAPSACAAAKTMTTELVKPTSTATKPATTAASDTSVKNFLTRRVSPCTWRLAGGGVRQITSPHVPLRRLHR